MKLSVVTPVYNEAQSLPILHKELSEVLSGITKDYEIIMVNDGSKDRSLAVLEELAATDKKLKVIHFGANRGQTAALLAGIKNASGDVIVTIDSDLENNPADIPRLLEKMEHSGADIVSGWRVNRWKDSLILRRIPSHSANWLISKMTGLTLHDHGSTLKAYRRGVFDGVELYGDMHRFIPAYLSWRGASVAELPVDHRPRRYGASNYGIGRVFRVILDLIVLWFLNAYINHPMRFFGGLGIISLMLGGLSGVTAIVLKIFHIRSFVETPLPTLTALFIIVGVQLVMMGVLAELLVRVYYESQGKRTYVIKRTINFD